jgi:hypothetical protein
MSEDLNLGSLPVSEMKEFLADNLPAEVKDQIVNPQPMPMAKKRICVGVLAYDARVHTRYMMCLMQGVMDCAANGWGFTYILRESDSMVARGRSFLASQFLENPDTHNCTDLVFADTDLAWEREDFVRLCGHPVDIVGGAYPFKDESGNFPLQWCSDGVEALDYGNGPLWRVNAVTPGFFRVSRHALEKIARESPWIEFKDRGNPEGQRSFMFFDNLARSSGVYDEGYVFCEHARRCGFTIHLDPSMHFTHYGVKGYSHGTIAEWLERKRELGEKLISEYPGVPPLVLNGIAMAGESAEKAREKAAAEAAKVGGAA